MTGVSVLGTALLSGALFVPVLYFTEAADAGKTKWDDMESIEASIAYSAPKQKQPQKPVSNPETKKDEGVSHDENKKVELCKADSDCKKGQTCEVKTGKCIAKDDKPVKVDAKDPFKNFQHTTDDDNEAGKPTTQPGEFNGSQFGWAKVTKGDPFWQSFAKDIHDNWEIPSISDVSGTKPAGCFHLAPDGKIPEVKMKEKSGNDILDDSAQRALDAVKKLRNDHPVEVPSHLLGAITGWICFRFDPNS